MRRIDRYLLSEIVIPALMGGLMVIMLLVGNQLYFMLRYLYKGVPLHDVVLTLVYFTPSVLMLSIPAALLLGTALCLNRLERDREILSLRMAGVRLKRVVLPVILLGVIASGVMFYLQERVIPSTTHKAITLQQKLAIGSPTAFVQDDQVYKVESGGLTYFIYVRKVDPNPDKQILRDITIVMRSGDAPPRWMMIPLAENRGGQWYMRSDPLTGVKPRIYAPGSMDVECEDGILSLPKETLSTAFYRRSSDELTFHELLSSRKSGVSGASVYSMNNGIVLGKQTLLFYMHRKLAAPLAALVAILIAIPLAVHFGRSGGYVGLLLSVIVAFCFIITQQWTQVLAEMGRLNPIFAAWAPDAFFGILGLLLLVREE